MFISGCNEKIRNYQFFLSVLNYFLAMSFYPHIILLTISLNYLSSIIIMNYKFQAVIHSMLNKLNYEAINCTLIL